MRCSLLLMSLSVAIPSSRHYFVIDFVHTPPMKLEPKKINIKINIKQPATFSYFLNVNELHFLCGVIDVDDCMDRVAVSKVQIMIFIY